ncbi:MAG: DUF2489 domain-containing protein [Nitrosomonadales bacterium]
MTPEQEIARKKKLVSAAKALLSLQVGFAIGCVRIQKILYWLRMWDCQEGQVFREFLNATREMPIGNDRLFWSPEALIKSDAKLTKIEAKYRPAILNACVNIIATYG